MPTIIAAREIPQGLQGLLAALTEAVGEESEGFHREHMHKCPKCGATWSHVPANIKDFEKAHCCPMQNCDGFITGFDDRWDASEAQFKNWQGDDDFELTDNRRKEIQEYHEHHKMMDGFKEVVDTFLNQYVKLAASVADEKWVKQHAHRFGVLVNELIDASIFSELQVHANQPMPEFMVEIVSDMLKARKGSNFGKILRRRKGRRGNGTAS